MKDANKARKPIFRTHSPFTPPKASQLQQPQHDAVVQFLVNGLTAIGEYRSNLPKPVKKRSKKRRRTATSAEEAKREEGAPGEQRPPVQPPRTQEDVVVGFNAVTRHLEALSALSNSIASGQKTSKDDDKPRHVAAVFLLRPLDDLIYSHLPTLCHTASLAHPELPATRLVLLDPASEEKVAAALAQSPNVSMLAILEVEQSEESGRKVLADYVRREVQAVEVPWLKEAMEAQWLGTKVDVQ